MNREILFRGKHNPSNEWIFGDLVYHNIKEEKIFIAQFIVSEIRKHGIYAKVKIDTVGQFTGLTDKNGTKIFENDIVSFKRGTGNWTGKTMTTIHVVSWDETVARFSLGKEKQSIKFRSHPRYEYEVLGNIFDNPELLEVAN